MTRTVLIMAGGTGGHVFPALAVAEALRGRGVEVAWVGTRRGLEARVVPGAGIPMHWLSVSGLRGKSGLSRLAGPFRLALALVQAAAIVLRVRPHSVLGMGGFAAGPGGVVAWLLRRPLVVHEQNAVAGLTNRVLATLAKRVLCAFPDTFPEARHPEVVGNPVRAAIASMPDPEERFAARTGPVRVLVLGGSQGALALNRAVPRALAQLGADLAIRHQAGRRSLEVAREAYADAGLPEARIEPFIEDMAGAYGWADLVIARAGALTVAELAAAGVGSVLLPYPYAVDDHQTLNARWLTEVDAGVALPARDPAPESLVEVLAPLVGDRQRLLEMACAARGRARPDAAARVAEACIEPERKAA